MVTGLEPRLPPQAKEHARSRSRLFEGELGASGEPPPAPRAAHRIAHSTSPAAWITASPRLAACSPSHHRLERVTGLASASRAAPVASRARATPRARPPTAPRSRGMGPEQVVWTPICDSQGGRGRCVRRQVRSVERGTRDRPANYPLAVRVQARREWCCCLRIG